MGVAPGKQEENDENEKKILEERFNKETREKIRRTVYRVIYTSPKKNFTFEPFHIDLNNFSVDQVSISVEGLPGVGIIIMIHYYNLLL